MIFVGLAILVKTTTYLPIDLVISKAVQTINFHGFAQAMTALTATGWWPQINILLGVIILSLFLLGKKLAALFIILISLVDTALFVGISNLINRPRPSPDLIRVDWKITVGGFPSGHVLLDTLVFGFLIYLTVIYVKNLTVKFTLIIIFSSIIILISVARIYSGQHWPSDVFGAYLLGSIWLIIFIYFYNLVKDLELSFFLRKVHQILENR